MYTSIKQISKDKVDIESQVFMLKKEVTNKGKGRQE